MLAGVVSHQTRCLGGDPFGCGSVRFQVQCLARMRGPGAMESLAGFARNMSTSLSAGLPVGAALKLSLRGVPDGLRAALQQSLASVEAGRSLGSALEPAQRHFPKFAIPLIRAAELSGRTAEGFEYLERLCRKVLPILRIVRKLWLYPLCILGFGAAVKLGIFWHFHAKEAAIEYILQLGLSAALIWTLAVLVKRIRALRRCWDRFLIRAAIAGPAIQAIDFSLFFQTFNLMYKCGGHGILAMLDISLDAVGNTALREDLERIRASLIQQNTLAEAFSEPRLNRPEIRSALVNGALAGKLEEALDFATQKLFHEMESQLQWVEQILLRLLGFLLMGSIIGTVSMFL